MAKHASEPQQQHQQDDHNPSWATRNEQFTDQTYRDRLLTTEPRDEDCTQPEREGWLQ